MSKTLEELAAEWESEINEPDCDRNLDQRYVRGWGDGKRDCFNSLRAYLAARPASDLEQRLRERARIIDQCCGDGMADTTLLLEAADALAHEQRRVEVVRSERDGRIAELESELAAARQHALNEAGACIKAEDELQRSKSQGWHDMRKRAEAAEARLAEFALRMTDKVSELAAVRDACKAHYEARQVAEQELDAALDAMGQATLMNRAEAAEARLAAARLFLHSQGYDRREIEAALATAEPADDPVDNPRSPEAEFWQKRRAEALATPAQPSEEADRGE
jgi:hypothetical protein